MEWLDAIYHFVCNLLTSKRRKFSSIFPLKLHTYTLHELTAAVECVAEKTEPADTKNMKRENSPASTQKELYYREYLTIIKSIFSNIFHAFGDDNSNLVESVEWKKKQHQIHTSKRNVCIKLLNTSVNTSRYRCAIISQLLVWLAGTEKAGERRIYHTCSICMELKRLQWPLIWIKNHFNRISTHQIDDKVKKHIKWLPAHVVQSLLNAFNPTNWNENQSHVPSNMKFPHICNHHRACFFRWIFARGASKCGNNPSCHALRVWAWIDFEATKSTIKSITASNCILS